MRTKILLIIVCLTLVLLAQAQKKRIQFQSMVQVGLLEGEVGSALQLQTINGIKYKTLSAGIGAGLDYYHTRSIPLFLDIRKAFGSNKKAPFIYVSGGYNFPWLRKAEKLWLVANTKEGMYYDAGVGYQLPVLKGSALFFSAGYSVKKFSTTNFDGVVIAIYPSPPLTYYENRYSLPRISVKTGLRF